MAARPTWAALRRERRANQELLDAVPCLTSGYGIVLGELTDQILESIPSSPRLYRVCQHQGGVNGLGGPVDLAQNEPSLGDRGVVQEPVPTLLLVKVP